MSMYPIWPGNLLRHGLVSLVLAILLIWQLSAPAQARTESQAAPGPGNVVVRGPGESAGPGRQDLPQKRVLILYSEDKAHPGHELTDQGIRAAFRSNKLFDVQLFSEYLDLSRFGGTGHEVSITRGVSVAPPGFILLLVTHATAVHLKPQVCGI